MKTNELIQYIREGKLDARLSDIYLDASKLNDINTPIPGSFDESILKYNRFDESDRIYIVCCWRRALTLFRACLRREYCNRYSLFFPVEARKTPLF